MQFDGDPEEEVTVQRIVVRNKRPCRRATGRALKDRRLDFQIAAVVEEAADARDDLRSGLKNGARFRPR